MKCSWIKAGAGLERSWGEADTRLLWRAPMAGSYDGLLLRAHRRQCNVVQGSNQNTGSTPPVLKTSGDSGSSGSSGGNGGAVVGGSLRHSAAFSGEQSLMESAVAAVELSAVGLVRVGA